jgi:hypothetical protein
VRDIGIKFPKLKPIKLNFGFQLDNAIHTPPPHPELKEYEICYENSESFITQLNIQKNIRIFALVSGRFIFGDALEAFFIKKDKKAKELTIITLSLSQENIDSIKNLLVWGRIDKLNLVLSDYFYNHEKDNLIKYIYQEFLSDDWEFQLSICATHTKIILIETYDNDYFVWHGSANLRSSDNIEQICIEENKQLYDFNMNFWNKIIDYFQTINKSLRGKKAWNLITSKL